MSLADGGIRLSKRFVVLDDSMGRNRTNHPSLWHLGWPPGRPITGVGVLLPHRPSPDRDYGKFTDATPASRVVLAFFLDVGTAGCLEVATCGIAGCGLRAMDGLRAARRATHLAARALVRGGWISALDPLVPCPPHVALGPMATDLRWHRPGVPF